MTQTEILMFIRARNGAYGNEIGDDDETIDALTLLVEKGWVRSEPSRLDDYFYLTKAGKQASRR